MQPTLVLFVLGFAALAIMANGCSDLHENHNVCRAWVNAGLCKEAGFAHFCKKSCGICDGGGGGGTPPPPPPPSPTPPPPSPPPQPGQCGYKPSARIFGGNEAPKGAWPWQAQVRSPSGFPFCGGTLVHPKFVVTAAHCVDKKSPKFFQVRLGAHKRRGEVGTEQDFKVEKIITHHSHKKPKGLAHDIAILKLDKPAVLNRAVNLACLPGSNGSVSDGKICWVTGFARPSANGASRQVLMQMSVPIVPQASCTKSYGPALIHDSMICAGYKWGGKGACQGNSGGPMVCESNGKFYLEGVVSWSKGCAQPGKYGVYARVRYLRKWVDSTITGDLKKE